MFVCLPVVDQKYKRLLLKDRKGHLLNINDNKTTPKNVACCITLNIKNITYYASSATNKQRVTYTK